MGNQIFAGAWEDLQVNVGRVTFPGSADPKWRSYNHGIGSGVAFTVLGFAVNDYVDFDVQTRHAMELSTNLNLHFHWMTPTDGTGDKFKFQADVIAAPFAGSWAAVTGSPFTAEESMAADHSGDHSLTDLADIPAVNTTVSTLYTIRFKRIAASADEYSGEVYVKFIDCHYQKDGIGSAQEDSKSPA